MIIIKKSIIIIIIIIIILLIIVIVKISIIIIELQKLFWFDGYRSSQVKNNIFFNIFIIKIIFAKFVK